MANSLDYLGDQAEVTLTRNEVMTSRSAVDTTPSETPPRPSAAPERPPTLDDLIQRPAWHQHAACRGRGPDDWFPTRGDTVALARARAICACCPVQVECLAHAQQPRATEHLGTWGGLSPRQRVRLRRRRDDTDDAA